MAEICGGVFSFPCATTATWSPTHHFVRDHLHFFGDFVVAASHEPLDRINRVFGIGDRLPLGHLPNQPLPGLGESHHRRRSPPPLFIRDHLGSPPSITATQELVVPKSIPIIFPIKCSS